MNSTILFIKCLLTNWLVVAGSGSSLTSNLRDSANHCHEAEMRQKWSGKEHALQLNNHKCVLGS